MSRAAHESYLKEAEHKKNGACSLFKEAIATISEQTSHEYGTASAFSTHLLAV